MSQRDAEERKRNGEAAETAADGRRRANSGEGSGDRNRDSTMAALLKEKPRRGRPRRAVSRNNVYVALTPAQKAQMKQLADHLPAGFNRADVPDLAITLLTVRLEGLRRAVADRSREIPEGVTDLDSLYLLWDLPLPQPDLDLKWTSIRVSPQQGIELGRVHGTLHALFGATRSEVFALALALFGHFLANVSLPDDLGAPVELQALIHRIYL